MYINFICLFLFSLCEWLVNAVAGRVTISSISSIVSKCISDIILFFGVYVMCHYSLVLIKTKLHYITLSANPLAASPSLAHSAMG